MSDPFMSDDALVFLDKLWAMPSLIAGDRHPHGQALQRHIHPEAIAQCGPAQRRTEAATDALDLAGAGGTTPGTAGVAGQAGGAGDVSRSGGWVSDREIIDERAC